MKLKITLKIITKISALHTDIKVPADKELCSILMICQNFTIKQEKEEISDSVVSQNSLLEDVSEEKTESLTEVDVSKTEAELNETMIDKGAVFEDAYEDELFQNVTSCNVGNIDEIILNEELDRVLLIDLSEVTDDEDLVTS